MPARTSEALILRTYPYREADLIVSFLTRDRGKLRGVARGVRRPKNKFGASLERLAVSRVFYVQKQNASLVTLQKAELAGRWNLWQASYPTTVLLDIIADAADRLLPEGQGESKTHRRGDAFFRLLRLIVGEFCDGVARNDSPEHVPMWAMRGWVYFLLWSARLGGWLPPLDRCSESERALGEGETCYFDQRRLGLYSAKFQQPSSSKLPSGSRSLAREMLRKLPSDLEPTVCSPDAMEPLERYLLQRTRAELESDLRGLRALESVRTGPQIPAAEG